MTAIASQSGLFAGFPPDCAGFLRDLAANNDRQWYQANKARFQTACLKPALDLITTLQEPLAGFNPPLAAVAKMNGLLRRLYRDLRFSKDKRPLRRACT